VSELDVKVIDINAIEPESFEAEAESMDIALEEKLIESNTNSVLRIEDTIHAYWTGVRGCGGDRHKEEVAAVCQRWLDSTIEEHSHLQMKWWERGAYTAHVRNWGGDWGSPRKCSGRASASVVVEFWL